MSEWDVVDAPQDEWAVAEQRPNVRNMPGGSVIPLYARDIARSILSVPVDVTRLLGHVTGREGMSRWGEGANEWLNRNVSPEANFSDDPVRAALQFGGSALIPMGWLAGPLSKGVTAGARAVLPAAVTGSRAAQVTGAGAMRAAELALPGSAPFTAGSIALNAGVGIGAGAGIEQLQRTADENRRTREQGWVPTAAAEPVAADDPWAAVPEDRSLAERVVDWLPYVAAGLGAAGVGAAARGAARMHSAAGAANQHGLVQPGTPSAATPMSGIGEQLVNGVADRQNITINRVNEAVRDGRMTREQGDDLIGTIITHANESITSDVHREFWSTGALPRGMTTEPPERLAFDIAQLRGRNTNATGVDDMTRFSDLMAAADELDVRRQNAREGRWRTGQPGVPQRSALSDIPDAELRRRVAEGRRNPEIAQLEQRYRNINNALLDYGVLRNVWTPDEIARMRTLGPNYMHRLVADLTLERDRNAGLNPITSGTERNSPIGERNRGEDGGPVRMQDPIMSMEDGIRQTLDFIRRNENLRNISRFMSVTHAPVGARPLLGIGRTLRDTPSAKVADGFVGVKFRDQGERYILELDPTISAGLLPYPRAAIPVLNAARILEQQLTTGPIGALLGNIQAPVSATMGMIASMINAPKHLRLGYVDKLVHHYSGGRVNLRAMGVVDPTFALQMGEAFIRDVIDHTAQVLAGSMQRSISTNGPMARLVDTLGAGRAQQMADAFMRHYLDSDLHRMRREGLHAQGLAYAAEGGGITDFAARVGNLSHMSPEYAGRMAYGGFAPAMTSIRSYQQLREYLAMNGARAGSLGGVRQARRVWQNYAKALDLVANMPQSAIYRANRKQMGRNEQSLIGTARSVTGDPAQYGSYRIVQGIMSAVPFGNITMQAGHQMAKAFKREPAAFAVRTAMTGTMLSLIMLQSAITADERAIAEGREPGAVAHMLTRDSRDAASAFRYYLPGMDPERSLRIPVEQSFAPLFSAILASMTTGFDVDNPEFFTGRYEALRDSIHRLIEDGDSARLRAGFGVAGADVPMTGAVDAAARMLTGYSVENAASFATGPRIQQVYDADGFERTLINNDVTDRYTATVLETALGYGGQALLDLMRTYGMAGREGGTGASLRATAEQYALNLTGAARTVGPTMFGQERRMRSNDIVGETIREAEQKLVEINRNLAQIRGGAGTIGSSTRLREAEYGGGRAGVPQDTAEVLMQFNQLYRQTDDLREQRRIAQETLRSYNSSPQLRADPQRLRTLTNEQAQRVREINAMIYQQILSAEADVSQQTGRRVRLSDLDPMKPLSQFPPLPGR